MIAYSFHLDVGGPSLAGSTSSSASVYRVLRLRGGCSLEEPLRSKDGLCHLVCGCGGVDCFDSLVWKHRCSFRWVRLFRWFFEEEKEERLRLCY